MNTAVQKAIYIIIISLGLAFVFNFLFFGKPLGVSVVIFISVLLGTVFLFGLQNKVFLRKNWWKVGLILFFALMPSIRANEFLIFLNILATFGLLMLLAHELVGTPTIVMKLRDYFVLAVKVPFRMLGRALATVSQVGQIHSDVKHRDVWIRVLEGAIVALPVIIIFGLLFQQADLAFSQFTKSILDITISERTMQYIALLVFAFVAALSFFSYIFFPEQVQTEVLPRRERSVPRERGIEVMVFLSLIATLFLMFIIFQITYLFGGETNIIQAGFTYAEYARRGFFELLAVAIMSLLILLAADKYANAESKTDKRFLIPALILITEVIVVIVSAFKRLTLYIDAYSMTMMRFYVAAFIIFLLVLFVLLAVKFIKSKPEQFFTFGTLLTAAACLIAMNVMNPDAFIIKKNIEQYTSTGKIDLNYVQELSADAAPGKLELYQKLEGSDKEALREYLQKQKVDIQNSSANWQSANFSRSRALKLFHNDENL